MGATPRFLGVFRPAYSFTDLALGMNSNMWVAFDSRLKPFHQLSKHLDVGAFLDRHSQQSKLFTAYCIRLWPSLCDSLPSPIDAPTSIRQPLTPRHQLHCVSHLGTHPRP